MRTRRRSYLDMPDEFPISPEPSKLLPLFKLNLLFGLKLTALLLSTIVILPEAFFFIIAEGDMEWFVFR